MAKGLRSLAEGLLTVIFIRIEIEWSDGTSLNGRLHCLTIFEND
jgi:hypothetical protein